MKENGEYVTEKTFTYEITEDVPEGAESNKLNGLTYDPGPKEVTVKVTDKGNGELETEVIYPEEDAETVVFENVYTAEGTGEIEVEKILTGRDWTTTACF